MEYNFLFKVESENWFETFSPEWQYHVETNDQVVILRRCVCKLSNQPRFNYRKPAVKLPKILINKLYPTQVIHYIRKPKDTKGKICVICGSLHFNKEPFCSGECSIKYCEQNGIWYQRVKIKVSSKKYCKNFNSEFRTRVRVFFGNRCFLCGKMENENGRKLSIHHVSYDKTALCNQKKGLFVPLCTPCHSKTNGNREYWESILTKRLQEEYNYKCYFSKEEFYNLGEIHRKPLVVNSMLQSKCKELEQLSREIEELKLQKARLVNAFYSIT